MFVGCGRPGPGPGAEGNGIGAGGKARGANLSQRWPGLSVRRPRTEGPRDRDPAEAPVARGPVSPRAADASIRSGWAGRREVPAAPPSPSRSRTGGSIWPVAVPNWTPSILRPRTPWSGCPDTPRWCAHPASSWGRGGPGLDSGVLHGGHRPDGGISGGGGVGGERKQRVVSAGLAGVRAADGQVGSGGGAVRAVRQVRSRLATRGGCSVRPRGVLGGGAANRDGSVGSAGRKQNREAVRGTGVEVGGP